MGVIELARATHTTLEVRDVASSLAFYRQVMGLHVNQLSALVGHVWATNGHYAAALQAANPPQQPLLNFYARPVKAGAVDAVHARVTAVRDQHGIREITDPAREDPSRFGVGTYGFYVNDLDGNWWRVEENGGPFGPAELPPEDTALLPEDAPPPIVPPGPIAYVALESACLERTVRFYRDFLGLRVEQPAPHYALCESPLGWVNVVVVDVGDRVVPQKVSNHHGLTIEGAPERVDALRQAAIDSSESFGIRKVMPATRQHGSYAFYFQDADTNCWELETWDDGISPVQRGLALKKGP
jgi:catechol 2,3-dioxygenase-like lactoylglutathione lyase family enzyme